MLEVRQFIQDMESCRKCANESCLCKKLVEYVDSCSTPEEALANLRTHSLDPTIMNLFYFYLNKINPEIYD
jgi:hypothetical protein